MCRKRSRPSATALRLPDQADFLRQLRETAERVLSSRAGKSPKLNQGAFSGASASPQRLLEKARQVARAGADVLIEAESGTGKELMARLIHLESPSRQRPSWRSTAPVSLTPCWKASYSATCAAPSPERITAKPGKFELANGGTILLDEVGEMPLELQPKLLRVLQEREVDPSGRNAAQLRFDVRKPLPRPTALFALRDRGRTRVSRRGLVLPAECRAAVDSAAARTPSRTFRNMIALLFAEARSNVRLDALSSC